MHADRFERLIRRVGARRTRRGVLALGAAAGAATIGGRSATAADEVSCQWRIELAADAGDAGHPRRAGTLDVTIRADGAVDVARLALEATADLAAVEYAGVGTTRGAALDLRLVSGACQAIVLTGAGDDAVATCGVRLDGLVRGAALGEVGAWRAWPLEICPPTEQFLADACTCAIVETSCVAETCPQGQEWDAAACACVDLPPAQIACGIMTCADGLALDLDACACVCPPWECKPNQVWDADLCMCTNLPCDLTCDPGFQLITVTCSCQCAPVDCDEGTWDGRECRCEYPQCPTGQIQCGGKCLNPATSRSHCGSCGNTCAAGKVCLQGVCM